MAVRQPGGPAANRAGDEPSTVDLTPWDLVTPADPWAHAPTPVDPLVFTPPPRVVTPPAPLPRSPSPKRVKKRTVAVVLLGLVACGLLYAWHSYPTVRQYPVHAVLPATFAGLTRRDDDTSQAAVARLDSQAQTGDAFAGVYGGKGGGQLTVFGVTGLRLAPAADVRAELDRLGPEFGLGTSHAYGLGIAGAHESCATGHDDTGAVVVCIWADHGSLATALITGRSRATAAGLTAKFRTTTLTPGFNLG